MSAGNNECITVVVRCRPMNKKEHDEHRKSIIDVDAENRQVGIRNPDTPNEPPKYFTYDATYDEKTQQKFFYEESCFNVIESTLEGFNSTIFAYGQTGCGKSFTMQGPSTTDENLRGVTPNSFSHIFQFVKTTKNIEFLIRCSYLELYNEEIRDLLIDPKLATKCELKEDPNKGIYVKGLTDVVVESPEDLHKMLDKGVSNRTTAATLMNSESSRSHSIFTIIVEMNTKDEMTGKDMLRVGKLNLVDLAGSERAKKTGATDKTLKEGIRINLSLSVLGNVISALADGGKFIPYRDSKLTRLLQDSLGGNTKTMMVAAISPADYNYDETLSTLRYANRAKNIKNKPKINEDPKDTMIREFKSEIERLRKLLAEQTNAASLLAQLDPTVLASAGAGGAKPAQTIQQPTVQHHPQPPALAVIEEVRSTPNSPQKVSRIIPSEQTTVGGSDSSTGVLQQESFVLGNVGSPSSVTTMNLNRDASNYTEEIVNEVISPTKSNSNNPMVKNVEVITTPRDMEQQIRGEIENRLHQLEHMLVNSEEVTITASPQKEITVKTNNAAGNIGPAISTSSGSGKDPSSSRANSAPVVPLLQFTKTPEQIAEEERQIQQYKERKLLAKKRREEKQQREILKVLEEKNQIAQELEELKQNLLAEKQQQQQQQQRPPSSTPQQIMNNHEDELDEFATRKLQKLKKRYEKKLTSVKEELDDLRDDFYYQRKQLMDAMLEQEKNCKLYEIICKSLIGERDVKKILEKCTYDDEKDEWIVPFIKRKNYDIDKLTNGVGQGEGYYSSNNNSGGGGGGGLFPDIYNPKDPGGAAANMNINGKSPLEQKFSSLQTGSWALNAPIETTDDNRRPVSQSRRVRSARANGNNTSEPQYSSIDSVSNYAGTKIPMVPLLTLPGSLVPASSLISPKPDSSTHHTGRNQANSTSSARADEYQNTNHVHNFTVAPTSNVVSLPGIGFNDSPSNNSNEERSKVKTASKNKNKLPKATPNQSIHNTNNNNAAAAAAGRIEESSSNRMPSINSHQNHYNTNNNINNSNNNTVSNQQLNYSTNAISNSYQQATDYSNVDEMGTGETAGPLHDWGFANPDPSITTTNHGKHKSKGHNYDLTPEEYNYENGLTAVNENYPNNNNYQFVSNTSNGKHSSHGTKKKKKSMENGNTLPATINGGSMFPPIENKHATPRGGGGGLSLPPI